MTVASRIDFPAEGFDIDTLEDEVRADRSCEDLLRRFAADLVRDHGFAAVEAGCLARGAGYFLREFLIGDRRENPFRIDPYRVRQFAATWYVIRNLEPHIEELATILEGVVAFYSYLAEAGRISPSLLEAIRTEAAALDFYRRRIDSFWAIEEDGYPAWMEVCSLDR